ncbi:MAG: peptidoglycan DD-metalloendopeptidase family protein [Candidatus Binatia bacterium]
MNQQWRNYRAFYVTILRSCGRWGALIVLPLAILLAPMVILLTTRPYTSPAKVTLIPAPEEPENLEPPEVPEPRPAPPRKVGVTFRRGDNLLSVLARFGLDGEAARALIKTARPFLNPKKIPAGQSFQLILDPQSSSVQGLVYTLRHTVVRVVSTPDGWSAERAEIPSVRETRVVRGRVTENFYLNGTEAGLTPLQILHLATIFQYDIDFFSDFRRGDTFSVVFEENHYANGYREVGRVLAAEVAANHKPFRAFYYAGKNGKGSYYDSDGRSVRRAFLRAPLSYRRISSRYSLRRRHPISRTLRPHRAIDYAAPKGTPVVAIGRGRVNFAGWRSGYGRLVELRHSNGYVTRYAHFSRIASGIRKGKKVGQGQVVGYVGQSGHATGPHLHFELLRRGKKINFLALRFPAMKRLNKNELIPFHVLRDQRLALLEDRGDQVAEAYSSPSSSSP